MPIYQNSTAPTDSNLVIGNYKIETALTSGGTYVNLGAGMVNKFGHNVTKARIQSGNAPNTQEYISEETFTIDMELIEYDASALAAISGGSETKTTGGSGVTVLNGGGGTLITDRAFKLTNTRTISGVTATSVITVYKATIDTGIQVTGKSDNDADPVNVMPVTVTGKNDSTRTAGSQLFNLTRTYNA